MSAPEPVFYTPRRATTTTAGGLLHAVGDRDTVAGRQRTVCGYVVTGATIDAGPMRPRLIDCQFCRAKLLEGVPVYAVGEADE